MPVKGIGENLRENVKNVLQSLERPVQKLAAILMGGAPSMPKEQWRGVSSLITYDEINTTDYGLIICHCLIHQENVWEIPQSDKYCCSGFKTR
jgi:hypothetical protein